MKENHKARRKDNGEWISGGYTTKSVIKCPNNCNKCLSKTNNCVHYIIAEDKEKSPDITVPFKVYEVEGETVCQSLGISDITGTEIYTHDILMFTDYILDEDGCQTDQTFDNFIELDIIGGRVKIIGIGEKNSFLIAPTSPFSYDYDLFLSALTQSAIIGNKFDD